MYALAAQRMTMTGGGSEYPPIPGVYFANDPAIAYTDCVPPMYIGGFMRFQRPISDVGSGYQYCMPGARQRFQSNAPTVNVQLRWNGLVTRTDARNLIGHVFVNGVYNSDFQTPGAINAVVVSTITINMGSSASRLYEIILPYADGVEFGQVSVTPPYVVTAAAARTGLVMACYGDSITQGFYATSERTSWPYLLAQAKGWRSINMGYGGRTTVSSDGTAIANLNPDRITVLMGTNDYLSQIPLATYQANLTALLQNIHAINASVPVYVSAPIYCATSLSIPLSSYQAIPGAVITNLGYPQLHGVDHGTLISNPGTQMASDGVHPNDAGSSQMASGWGAAMS
jgi:lysophospholipase L1-like esterase